MTRYLSEPLACDECGKALPDLTRSFEWTTTRLAEARRQRDQYKGWFDQLLAAAFDPTELQATVRAVKRAQTATARAARSADTDQRRRRAAELKATENLSNAAIGRRIAREEGRPDRPYTYGQVRGWLTKKGTD